uniref:Uncharacterized protein n=1 Tax=Arundo donax TaxID=35708 RepID=A0A0A8Y1G3_ARUDO
MPCQQQSRIQQNSVFNPKEKKFPTH